MAAGGGGGPSPARHGRAAELRVWQPEWPRAGTVPAAAVGRGTPAPRGPPSAQLSGGAAKSESKRVL